MPKPTIDLHAKRQRGVSANICCSARRCGFNRSLPDDTETAHVRHSPPAPQFPPFFVSNRFANGSLSFTPRISIPCRRFSPAYIVMVSSGIFSLGGYCRLTVTLGLRRIRFNVTSNSSVIGLDALSGGGSSDNASTVASYDRHSRFTVVTSALSASIPFAVCASASSSSSDGGAKAAACCAADMRINATCTSESPGTISISPAAAAEPPSTKPFTKVMPTPSSRPPANSNSSNPRPPVGNRGNTTLTTSANSSRSFLACR
mmetsp:Transcript_15898/g.43935  ORF Transcript_15898/g.43935 Transcript_15898/m.43935 type:complete len:260 (+) Transcript_15898:196-975(+)